jgi:ATP-dependent DNA helicase RecG
VLDELPPGRKPIHTRMIEDKEQAEVWKFLRGEVAAGHQAYIVYPVIEGAPKNIRSWIFLTEDGQQAAGNQAVKHRKPRILF